MAERLTIMSKHISPFQPEDNMPDTGTFDLHLGDSTWLKGFDVDAQSDLSGFLAHNGYNVFDHIGQHMGSIDGEIEDTTRPVVQWFIREHGADVPEMHEDLSDLCSKMRKHPDYRGGVVWSVDDIKMVAEEYGVSADALDELVDMRGWEGLSTEDGFEHSMYPQANQLRPEEDKA